MHQTLGKKANPVKPKSTGTRVRTITESAKILGVTREHLSRVLHGHRDSRSLTSRYNNLQSQRQLAA